jgi:hypothetical protein
MNIITEPIELDDILQYDTLKYNSNNHWTNDEQPNDYHEILNKTHAPYWIDKFKTYKKITIDIKKYNWMITASNLCSSTGKWSHLYDDELEQYLEENKDIIIDKEYFVRCDTVSLKYGMHKCGPYTNLKMIIESIVSSIKGHTPIYSDTEILNVYLIDWITINKNYEFRVFVYNNKITAVSQQQLYQKNKEIMDDNVIIKINDYFENEIKTKITHITNYVIDLCLIPNVYFIELNSFGKEYASGSALFHWILDEDKLLNLENKIYFRYVI